MFIIHQNRIGITETHEDFSFTDGFTYFHAEFPACDVRDIIKKIEVAPTAADLDDEILGAIKWKIPMKWTPGFDWRDHMARSKSYLET